MLKESYIFIESYIYCKLIIALSLWVQSFVTLSILQGKPLTPLSSLEIAT